MPAKQGDFDKKMQRLQKIVQELEKKDLPLEKGVQLFKEGMEITRTCREQLEKARHEITVLAEDAQAPRGNDEQGV